jgi:hypothetical protein
MQTKAPEDVIERLVDVRQNLEVVFEAISEDKTE